MHRYLFLVEKGEVAFTPLRADRKGNESNPFAKEDVGQAGTAEGRDGVGNQLVGNF